MSCRPESRARREKNIRWDRTWPVTTTGIVDERCMHLSVLHRSIVLEIKWYKVLGDLILRCSRPEMLIACSPWRRRWAHSCEQSPRRIVDAWLKDTWLLGARSPLPSYGFFRTGTLLAYQPRDMGPGLKHIRGNYRKWVSKRGKYSARREADGSMASTWKVLTLRWISFWPRMKKRKREWRWFEWWNWWWYQAEEEWRRNTCVHAFRKLRATPYFGCAQQLGNSAARHLGRLAPELGFTWRWSFVGKAYRGIPWGLEIRFGIPRRDQGDEEDKELYCTVLYIQESSLRPSSR